MLCMIAIANTIYCGFSLNLSAIFHAAVDSVKTAGYRKSAEAERKEKNMGEFVI